MGELLIGYERRNGSDACRGHGSGVRTYSYYIRPFLVWSVTDLFLSAMLGIASSYPKHGATGAIRPRVSDAIARPHIFFA